jgi:hypothetical protein
MFAVESILFKSFENKVTFPIIKPIDLHVPDLANIETDIRRAILEGQVRSRWQHRRGTALKLTKIDRSLRWKRECQEIHFAVLRKIFSRYRV